MINQSRHCTDVLAKVGQRYGRARFRIIAGHLQRSACEVGTLQRVQGRMLAPAVEDQPITTDRGPSECRPVAFSSATETSGRKSLVYGRRVLSAAQELRAVPWGCVRDRAETHIIAIVAVNQYPATAKTALALVRLGTERPIQ
jgi:hypothetical protein